MPQVANLISVDSVRVSSFEPSPTGNNGSVYYTVGTGKSSTVTKILVNYRMLYCEVHYTWIDDKKNLHEVVKKYVGLPFIATEQVIHAPAKNTPPVK